VSSNLKLSEGQTEKIAEELQPKLLKVSRLCRRMKRDLLRGVEKEQWENIGNKSSLSTVMMEKSASSCLGFRDGEDCSYHEELEVGRSAAATNKNLVQYGLK
jgi:hypothetical protein